MHPKNKAKGKRVLSIFVFILILLVCFNKFSLRSVFQLCLAQLKCNQTKSLIFAYIFFCTVYGLMVI